MDSGGHSNLIRQGKEEAHFSDRSVSSRPEPRSTMWTPDVSMKALSGIEQMSKHRAGGRTSAHFPV